MGALGQGPGTVLAAQERCCGSAAGACTQLTVTAAAAAAQGSSRAPAARTGPSRCV